MISNPAISIRDSNTHQQLSSFRRSVGKMTASVKLFSIVIHEYGTFVNRVSPYWTSTVEPIGSVATINYPTCIQSLWRVMHNLQLVHKDTWNCFCFASQVSSRERDFLFMAASLRIHHDATHTTTMREHGSWSH